MSRNAYETTLVETIRFSIGAYFAGRSSIVKHHADKYTGAGHADLYGHILGKHVEIEAKVCNGTYKGRFSSQQKAHLENVNRSGSRGFGLLWEVDVNAYWLLPGPVVSSFTYRNRDGWLGLPIILMPTHPHKFCLNLAALGVML